MKHITIMEIQRKEKNNMIDMHCHILPNIDDGSKNMEETIHMIKEAKKAGFTSLISTSHYIEGYYEATNQERRELIQQIQKELQQEKIDIYLGNENYFSDNLVHLIENEKASTINGTSYVLFEFPMNTKPLNIYNIIYDMIQNKLKPILAHPERYKFIQEDPNIIYDLIQKGVLMQANFASIIGYYGKAPKMIASKMLQNNMIHFLGTDAHRKNTIYPKIPEILKEISKIIGSKKLEELTKVNPSQVLKNEKIEIEEPQQMKLNLKEKLMMKL